jgi:hypothetical protein
MLCDAGAAVMLCTPSSRPPPLRDAVMLCDEPVGCMVWCLLAMLCCVVHALCLPLEAGEVQGRGECVYVCMCVCVCVCVCVYCASFWKRAKSKEGFRARACHNVRKVGPHYSNRHTHTYTGIYSAECNSMKVMIMVFECSGYGVSNGDGVREHLFCRV